MEKLTRKTFLKIAFALVIGGGVIPSANAELVECWAKGVSWDAGWRSTWQFTNGCWAAGSTNMIMWWEDRISEKYELPAGKKTEYDLISHYERTYGYYGVHVYEALANYFDTNLPTLSYRRSDLGYINYLDIDKYDNPIMFTRYCGYKTENVNDALMHWFTTGNYVAAITSYSHTWTLWGLEYDTETNLVTKIFATDSVADDKNNPQKLLHTFDVRYSDNYDDELYFSRAICKDEDGAITYDQQNIEPYEITFLGIEDRFLVDEHGNSIFVPEPSAFGIFAGVGALVAALSRRRRKAR